MRTLWKFLAVSSLLFVSFLVSTQSGYSQTSYTWSSVGTMTQGRTGAAAVLLPSGKVLITGGMDSNGVPQVLTETFDPASGGFIAAASMNVPRANHAAIVLNTGDVLVTGGLTTVGGYSDTAEIFNSQTGTWTLLEASLGAGLAKHAMAALPDGNVLIAGGESTTGPVGNLLLFKMADLSFAPIGTLLAARKDAVAAATPDGRVLVAGGTDINGVVLSSTEVFTYSPDTMTGAVAAGPNMTYARANATATTTYDGVAIIGGSNGSADLGSAEIFSQWTNAFRVVNGATPRSGHVAAFLPKNGSILAMGGSGGTAVDLLQPWGNNIAGAFLTGAPSAADHTGGFLTPATIGTMLAAGGSGSSAGSAEVYWFPTISTDQPDYAPGTPVVMSGMGFQPGETVKLYMREWVNQMLVDPPDYTVTADGAGSFAFMDYAPTPADLGARYHLTATGTASSLQAQTIFTDNYPKTNLTIAVNPAGGSPVANSVVAGSTSGASDYIIACTTTVGCTNTGTNINNGATIFITATAGTGRLFSSWSVSGDLSAGSTCANGYTGNPCSLNAGTGSKTTKVTANFVLTATLTPTLIAADKVYDGTVTEPDASMSCTLSGVHTGDNVTCTATNGSFATANAGTGIPVTATVTLGGVDAGKYTFGTAGTTVTSKAATTSAAITKATATINVTPYSVTYDGTAHAATGTATGIGSVDLSAGLSLSGTTHTNAGTFTDSWTFQDPNGNYANASGNVTDVIKQAKATVTVTPYTTTYDGVSHTATGSATGINSTVLNGGLVLTGTTHTKAATYSTDAWSFHDASGNYADDSGTVSDVINKADAMVVVTPYTLTYDGQVHTATATVTGVNSETGPTVGIADLSNTTHTNAGTYATDSWKFTGAANYKDIAATTITDIINKANATVSVTPYSVTYDGHAHTAEVAPIMGVNGETGATVGTVDVSNTSHTNAGTYTADSWTFTGTANYNNIAATVITDKIDKATATVVITPYTVTYDGQAHTATATVTGVNGEIDAAVGTVNLGNTTHTGAGTYSSDSWSFTGGANYNSIGATTITDTINKANASVVVTPYAVTYDGNPHTAAITSIAGVAGESGAAVGAVDLSHTSHTNAGTYGSDYWTFAPTANYNDIASQTITDTINKANAVVVVAPYTVTYDGNPHTATASITGVNGEVDAAVGTVNLSNTTHTGAGTYSTDSWSFTGGANYNNIGATTITDVINKANATVVVTPYVVTYDGHAHTAAIISITGVNGESGATVGSADVSSTSHTNAGIYSSDSWTFTGTANYNNIAATAITDTINKATAVVSVTPYTVTYDGNAHSAIVASITGVNGESGPTVGVVNLSTTHTNAGVYSADSWSFSGTANYNDIASNTITDTINKATAIVNVTPYTVTYDGQPHSATIVSITGVNGESGATVGTAEIGDTTHTAAGTYSGDFWTFTGTANYNNIAATTITDTINKANATVVVTPYTVTYDGKPHTAAITSITGVNGEMGSTVGTVDVSNTAHTGAGTYSTDFWTFSGANYNDIGATAITDTINKANATVVVTPYSVTYDGKTHIAATASITGVNGETGATVGIVDLANTEHIGAGTYSTDFWTFSGANYNSIAATIITDTINKAYATIVVTPYTVTYDGTVHTAEVTSITGVNGETGATVGTVDLSNTSHTGAGTYPADSWSFSGANYNSIAATTITDTINKANAIVVVTPYDTTYNGLAHTATASINGVNGETGTTVGIVDLSNTSHAVAGTYSADFWTFSGANYNSISATPITDTIHKANAIVTVTPYTITYDGQAHTATASITGVNGEIGATVGTVNLNTAHTNAGIYSADSWSFTGAANYNDIASTTITDTINKANATVVVAPYTVTYDGKAHTATVTSIVGANGEMGATVGTVNLSSTTHTAAGTYAADSWAFTGTANYIDIGATNITDTINKANATIVVTPYTVTYDGQAHTATVTSITGVNGESGDTVGKVDVSNTTHTLAGDYPGDPWSFTPTNNYMSTSGTVHDVINHWTVSGFYSPVVPTTGTVVWNVIKGGSTVPLKFNIYAAGVQQTSTTAVKNGSVVVYQANCNIGGVANTATDYLTDTGATTLRFDTAGLQFIQNWKTPKGSGCYVAQMTAADGTMIQAYFTAN